MDKPTLYLINQKVGQAFPFFQRFRVGGIGSKRMKIIGMSEAMERYRMPSQDTQFGLLEIRPEGILVLTNRHLQNFTWPIHYEDLVIEGEKDLVIRSGENFVCFEEGRLINEGFLSKNKQLWGRATGVLKCKRKYQEPSTMRLILDLAMNFSQYRGHPRQASENSFD